MPLPQLQTALEARVKAFRNAVHKFMNDDEDLN